MKAAILFTGGKDSCLALLKAKKQGYSIKYLLTVLPTSSDSYMYHKPSTKLLRAQAKILNIPLIVKKSISKKESEIRDLSDIVKKVKGKVDTIVIGGIASNYQAKRIKKVIESSKLRVFAPLWNYSSEKLWQELLKNKFKVIITKISCDGLPKDVVGKVIDAKLLKQLKSLSRKYKFNLTFEGGDAETSVLYCPLFRNKIKLKTHIKSESDYRHFLIIDEVKI